MASLDVKALTLSIQKMADDKLDLTKKLDNELFQHISYVSNQSLLLLKKEGATVGTRTKIGKMLWRLFLVVQAYNSKNRDVTVKEVLSLISEFKGVFTGA